MANLQATIRGQQELAKYPSRLMARVNYLFFESTRPEHFATLFYGVYEAATRNIRYVSCGHPSAVLLRANGDFELLDATATVLGAFKDCGFEERSVPMGTGDRLVLFSDGFSEAQLNSMPEERAIDGRWKRSCRSEDRIGMTALPVRLRRWRPRRQAGRRHNGNGSTGTVGPRRMIAHDKIGFLSIWRNMDPQYEGRNARNFRGGVQSLPGKHPARTLYRELSAQFHAQSVAASDRAAADVVGADWARWRSSSGLGSATADIAHLTPRRSASDRAIHRSNGTCGG